jgi:hypothetical protein
MGFVPSGMWEERGCWGEGGTGRMQIKLWGFVSTFLIDCALQRARMEADGGL